MKKLIVILLILAFSVISAHALRPRVKIITGTHTVWVDRVDWLEFDGHTAIIHSSGRIRIISGDAIPVEK